MNNECKLYLFFCEHRSINPDEEQLLLIESLQNKGLKIIVSSDEYFLSEPILFLSESQVRSGLDDEINKKIDRFDVFYETESTNIDIANNPINSFYSIVVSEYQSSGKGRRENSWSSPLGSNLYFSVKFNLKETTNTSFIPLVTARAICKSLQQLGINNCKIKWPNDIFINGLKVAGILTESHYSKVNGVVIIVGIGINVNMVVEESIDQQWTSLKISQNKSFNRNTVLSIVLKQLILEFEMIPDFNIKSFLRDWNDLDFLKGKIVMVIDDQLDYSALVIGLADDGALVVQSNNEIRKVYSANISIKTIT